MFFPYYICHTNTVNIIHPIKLKNNHEKQHNHIFSICALIIFGKRRGLSMFKNRDMSIGDWFVYHFVDPFFLMFSNVGSILKKLLGFFPSNF